MHRGMISVLPPALEVGFTCADTNIFDNEHEFPADDILMTDMLDESTTLGKVDLVPSILVKNPDSDEQKVEYVCQALLNFLRSKRISVIVDM
jgi:hypothetical protein